MSSRLVPVVLLLLISLSLACSEVPPPVADFSAEPRTGEAPIKVQFTDLSKGNISAWEWDFENDGEVDSRHPNPSYTYIYPGNYTVSLSVRGPGGNYTMVKPNYLGFTTPPCLAAFYAQPREVDGEVPIKFTDQSLGHITGWEWDFNSDGYIDSNERNPSYTYTENDSYSVTLTITGPECPEGVTHTEYNYIQVKGCAG